MAKINNIVFTCAFLHNMLIEFDEWSAADDEYDIITNVVTDVQRQDMDPRIENLRRGPVDQSYIGGLDIQENEVEYETDRKSMIEHYAVCFRLKLNGKAFIQCGAGPPAPPAPPAPASFSE